MPDVTQILNSIDAGDPHAADQLLPLVYDELRKLAATKLAHEQPGQTLDATSLVHEAYLRLVASRDRQVPVAGEVTDNSLPPGPGGPGSPIYANRGHFFAAAAEAMRRILVDRARQRRSLKRGGHHQRDAIDPDQLAASEPDEQLLALNEALDRLATKDPQKAALVKLRYFAGLTADDAAAALAISPSTADRMWFYARAWLRREMGEPT